MAEASAPASSANLGPGFDTLALALDVRCRVRAEPANEWRIEHLGPHSPDSGSPDAVLAAAQRAVGSHRPLHLTVANDIPVARGLGSSAAAFAASVLAAWRAAEIDHTRDDLFAVVSDLEGHADNAAAAVYGGLRAVTTGGRTHSLSLHPQLRPVVAIPNTVLSTREARAALSSNVPREVVVRSIQRMAALIEGLRNADPELLAAAGGDEIHEAPRLPLNPLAAELIDTARSAGALFACWSGAGSSILSLTDAAHRPPVVAALREVLGEAGVVTAPDVDRRGAE